MTLCCQKVKKHGKMSMFSTTIENENENPSLQNTIDVNLLFCSFNSVLSDLLNQLVLALQKLP